MHVGAGSSGLLSALLITPHTGYEPQYNWVRLVTLHQDCIWFRKHPTMKLGQAFGVLERWASINIEAPGEHRRRACLGREGWSDKTVSISDFFNPRRSWAHDQTFGPHSKLLHNTTPGARCWFSKISNLKEIPQNPSQNVRGKQFVQGFCSSSKLAQSYHWNPWTPSHNGRCVLED